MINPVRVTLSAEAEAKLKRYIKDRLLALKEGLKEYHTQKLPTWRKIYTATPAESIREFPFHNASNLVVPVAAIYADTLKARMMAAVWKTQPLWVTKTVGSQLDKDAAERQRGALEEGMGYLATEPDEFDLYRVYNDWIDDIVKYGTGVVKAPWIHEVEHSAVPAGDGTGRFGGTTEFDKSEDVLYDGPRPEKVALNDFGATVSARTLDAADFKYHRCRLQRHDLEERRFFNLYDRMAVNSIIRSPDRTSPEYFQQELESESGTHTRTGYGWAEWDVYECWFKYRINKGIYRLVVSYHLNSDTILRAFYRPYPEDIFVMGRLYYEDGLLFGNGFCWALGPFQEEISTIHNQRRDASTVANANFMRVDPDSKLNEGYRIFPGATVPGEKDEVEPMQFGQPSQMTIDEERLALDLAERRVGVSQPQQAMGSGAFNKRGVYTAMGTLSLLQEGNNRSDLNISDFRYAHTKLGRLLARELAEFGLDSSRYRMFGGMAEDFVGALRALRAKTMAIKVLASNASINREVEKQNDLMLTGIMQRHYSMVTQLLQAVSNPQIPPALSDYLKKVIKAANLLMETTLRHFGQDEPVRLVPEPTDENPARQPQPSPQMVQQSGLQALPGAPPLPFGASATGTRGPVQ